MVIQIFGKKNCNDSKKAVRFFKERKVDIQFVDLNKFGISKGELKAIKQKFPLEDLLDTDSKEYKKKNLQYMAYDTEELLSESPSLYKTPIVRFKNKVTLGYNPDIWEEWLKK